jgi:TctA family transporter
MTKRPAFAPALAGYLKQYSPALSAAASPVLTTNLAQSLKDRSN